MGVRRAMELVLEEANRSEGPLYTFGPLIHNRQVMELLERKGIQTVNELEELSEGEIVIRAHGIPPHQRRLLKRSRLRIIDGTCPRVARVQAIIRYHTRKGLAAVIVGDREHPEVIGLMGHGEGPVSVINSVEEVAGLNDDLPYFMVAQTTQDEKIYNEITREMLKRFPGTKVFDTICDATHQRQEVRQIARIALQHKSPAETHVNLTIAIAVNINLQGRDAHLAAVGNCHRSNTIKPDIDRPHPKR